MEEDVLQTTLKSVTEKLESAQKELVVTKSALSTTERRLKAANSYNGELRKYIHELSKQLHDFKKKSHVADVGIQVEITVGADRCICKKSQLKEETVKNKIKNELVAATGSSADTDVKHIDYVYDDESALYYNYTTHYYYDPKSNLYYDTSSEKYYYYNEDTKTYECQSHCSGSKNGAQQSRVTPDDDITEEVPHKDTTIQQEKEETSDCMSIAEVLRSTAEAAVQETGFVYDETSGLYYDHNTGYYYNSENGLYFESSTGCYYFYNPDAQTYEYHSQEPRLETDQLPCEHKTEKAQYSAVSEVTSNTEKSLEKKHKQKLHRKKRKKETKTKKNICDKEKMGMKIVPVTDRESAVKDNFLDTTLDDGTGLMEIDSKEKCDNGAKCELTSDLNNIANNTKKIINGSEMDSESSERESGELSDSESEYSTYCESESDNDEMVSDVDMQPVDERLTEIDEDLLQTYPPCIRAVVKESDCLDEGHLFIVTCDGISIGREKSPANGIVIPDMNLNKTHAEFTFDWMTDKYCIVDAGSFSGTFINGQRISEPKKMSLPVMVEHDSVVQFGGTKFLLHIHPGQDTCDQCEPGQIQAMIKARDSKKTSFIIQTKDEKKKEFRKNMKTIKKRYGLENADYVDDMKAIKNPSYDDRAGERRKNVGSDHPSVTERDTEPASVHREISSENVGHKLLKKMGWKEGESLGKDNTGIIDPVHVKFRANKDAGLGSDHALECSIENVHLSLRNKKWIQAQQRFNKIQGPRLPE